MKLRVLFFVAGCLAAVACQCGGGDLCAQVKCAPGLVCEPKAGRCVVAPVDGGTGGGGSGGSAGSGGGAGTGGASSSCSPACTAQAPVCDPATQSCRICTATQGCAAPTPVCISYGNGGLGRCMACDSSNVGCGGTTPICDLTVGPNGACVACSTNLDCTDAALPTCDPGTHTCVAGSGSGGGTGGGGGTWPGAPVWGADGGTQHCLPIDAGVVQCVNECRSGFECVAGQCVLRGSAGPVQVTLRWPYPEDLDLHVVEPLRDGGTCELWYGNRNTSFDAGAIPFPLPFPLPTPQSCGAKGWLDLDSNPACQIDNVDTENVIYSSSATVTPGKYIVRVDYYQHCSIAPVPYEVEVRVGNSIRYFCGSFNSNEANGGNAGSGRFITDFTIR